MAMKALTFHLPEETNPCVTLAILETWASDPERRFTTSRELLDTVREVRDIPNRTESINFAVRLGLIAKKPDDLALMPLARILTEQRDGVRNDALHFLAYTAWTPEVDGALVPFWSYRSTCDALWEASPTRVDDQKGALVEHIIATSQEYFADNPSYDPDRVSYGVKSFRAILKWLEPLTPPVITDGMFCRRPACSAELLLLAVAQAHRQINAEPGVELLLTAAVRETICRLCLLDPAHLDRVLDWALARYTAFVDRADQSGSYGRSVRLRYLPSIEDVLANR